MNLPKNIICFLFFCSFLYTTAQDKKQLYEERLQQRVTLTLKSNKSISFIAARICRQVKVPYSSSTTRKYVSNISSIKTRFPVREKGYRSAKQFLSSLASRHSLEFAYSEKGVYFRYNQMSMARQVLSGKTLAVRKKNLKKIADAKALLYVAKQTKDPKISRIVLSKLTDLVAIVEVCNHYKRYAKNELFYKRAILRLKKLVKKSKDQKALLETLRKVKTLNIPADIQDTILEKLSQKSLQDLIAKGYTSSELKKIVWAKLSQNSLLELVKTSANSRTVETATKTITDEKILMEIAEEKHRNRYRSLTKKAKNIAIRKLKEKNIIVAKASSSSSRRSYKRSSRRSSYKRRSYKRSSKRSSYKRRSYKRSSKRNYYRTPKGIEELKVAIEKTSDQTELAAIVKDIVYRRDSLEVQMLLIEKLTDPPALKHLVQYTRYQEIKKAIVENIRDQKVLAYCVSNLWFKHKEIAKDALEKISDQEVLAKLTKNARTEIQEIIIKKLTLDKLAEVATHVRDEKLHIFLLKKLVHHKGLIPLIKKIKNRDSLSYRVAMGEAIKKIKDQKMIAQFVIHVNSGQIKSFALDKITDGKALAYLAINVGKYPKTIVEKISARIHKIKDQNLLIKVFKNSPHGMIRVSTLWNLEDEKFLIKKAQTTDNKQLKRIALQKIKNQKVLRDFARSSQDADIIAALLTNLKDPHLLKEIYRKYPHLKIMVLKNLDDIDFITNEAVRDEGATIRIEAVKKVTDPQVLADLVLNDPHFMVREKCIQRIEDLDTLQQVVRREKKEKIKNVALKKINDIVQKRYQAQESQIVVLMGIVVLIVAIFCYSLWVLITKKKILLLASILLPILFCCLYHHIFVALGPSHYHFKGPPDWSNWTIFTSAHILRATDVLDIIEEYNISLQSIKHNSSLAGISIIAMHWITDIFLLGILFGLLSKGWDRFAGPFIALRDYIPGFLDKNVFVFLVGLLYVFIALLQGWSWTDMLFLWPLDNIIRVIDIGDTFQVLHWQLHSVKANIVSSTLAIAFRLAVGISVASYLIKKLKVFVTPWEELVETLENAEESNELRMMAIQQLENIQEEDIKAKIIPVLGKAALHANGKFKDTVCIRAAQALGKFGPDAKNVVPYLINGLDEADFIQKRAVMALGEIGRHAQKAIPALLKALLDADEKVYPKIIQALDQIDLKWHSNNDQTEKILPSIISTLAYQSTNAQRAAEILQRIAPIAKRNNLAVIKESLAQMDNNTRNITTQMIKKILKL